ncbi:pyridoxine 5'-phosphate synthase [Dokdonella sp.]|uniref:pyridoxine 5'-phosphate synthase n=1 Tax=Dokdonella sp. TaxID=2291710 RepID=UPI001AFD76FE|nr:pyridoxine 5'-phosphate synthase [Dokdonella sp.]MBO9661621.1 pyridoxine 5'-phosphate synthase [Dokdonella sp.]
MTALSVNVNKIAVLRNSRGHALPDPVTAARVAIEAGCHGITVHPRPDQRHIRADDVPRIGAVVGSVEFNIEGNPFAPARGSYPGYLELVRAARPAQATLVPDGDAQLTSDHGFDLGRDAERLRPLVRELKSFGCRVSLFVDAGCEDVERAAEIGADRIEIYTEPYASAFAAGEYARALDACARTAERARVAGLGVNAGHDLDQRNLGALLRAIPFLAEVSIGHALIGESIYDGLAPTVRKYLAILADARGAA